MGEARVRIEAGPGDRAILRVAGALPPGWCGNLATGLARRGIGIDSGHALCVHPGHWRGEFTLDCPRGERPLPTQLAPLLEVDAGAGFTTPIELLDYRLEPSRTREGCLILEVEGPDRVGFLAALLRRLAYLALFPVELRLETRRGLAHDRLWLRGAGGRAPLPRTEKALAASLDALVCRRA